MKPRPNDNTGTHVMVGHGREYTCTICGRKIIVVSWKPLTRVVIAVGDIRARHIFDNKARDKALS